jgi:hypothetical protein
MGFKDILVALSRATASDAGIGLALSINPRRGEDANDLPGSDIALHTSRVTALRPRRPRRSPRTSMSETRCCRAPRTWAPTSSSWAATATRACAS